VTCTGAGADSSAAGLPSPGGSAGESSFKGFSSEDASGASSIAVEGTSKDSGAESSAATNDTLDTDLTSCPFPSTYEERSHDVSSIRIP
jgi:hypothetical protein